MGEVVANLGKGSFLRVKSENELFLGEVNFAVKNSRKKSVEVFQKIDTRSTVDGRDFQR